MMDLLTPVFLSTFIIGVILGGMPLMLSALGETIGERAGILNLGIEGMMLIGGYIAYVVTLQTESIWLGLLAGALGGLVTSLIMLVLNVWLGLNQIVLGIAITLLGGGITGVLYDQFYLQATPRVAPPADWNIPVLESIPVVGTSVFSQPVMFWVAMLLAVAVAWFLNRTNWSLSVKAAGERPSSLDAAGGSVMGTRSGVVLIGGAFAGLGGAYLSLIVTNAFTPFMTHGLGYVAIIVTMLCRGRVFWVVGVSFLYGVAVSFGTTLQLTTTRIPTDILGMLPFIVVMLMLIIFARSVYIPPALAAPYTRGAR